MCCRFHSVMLLKQLQLIQVIQFVLWTNSDRITTCRPGSKHVRNWPTNAVKGASLGDSVWLTSARAVAATLCWDYRSRGDWHWHMQRLRTSNPPDNWTDGAAAPDLIPIRTVCVSVNICKFYISVWNLFEVHTHVGISSDLLEDT